MSEQNLAYQVGDQVIHWVYGLGEIIRLDEKVLAGQSGKYYVVEIRDLTLWVPMNETGEHCLRFPTPAKDFQELFHLLASPGEPLSTNRFIRKTELMELLKIGTLEAICRIVRDLMYYKQTNKVNENDNSILERAKNFLLDEWSVALSISTQQAERKLMGLLETSVV